MDITVIRQMHIDLVLLKNDTVLCCYCFPWKSITNELLSTALAFVITGYKCSFEYFIPGIEAFKNGNVFIDIQSLYVR